MEWLLVIFFLNYVLCWLLKFFFNLKKYRAFPGGPVVKSLHFHLQGARVQSLVGELRSCLLHNAAKNL